MVKKNKLTKKDAAEIALAEEEIARLKTVLKYFNYQRLVMKAIMVRNRKRRKESEDAVRESPERIKKTSRQI